ncbi:RDD family protein [Phenylobacterium sp. J426]|uniref:RDD family protein n=1 Tax=Phenylobacterium sp. J426 TaxID=2898439 RepID=UPI002151D75D|nr:RDD family protein [Phenylobacterium sp. J426]MCR5874711.1 RDD family protein [Phenylobacterium sp. J426]
MGEEGRAAIWRRLAAAAVDAVFFILAASLISVALYNLSDGRLRAYVFQPVDRCEAVGSISPAVARAALAAIPGSASRVVGATACRRLFLGLESGRFVSVNVEVQQGETVMGAAVLQPVDRAGEPVRPLAFGWAYPLAFVVSMAIGEGLLGGTPGKAGFGVRVVQASGGRLGLPKALVRNAIVYAWLLAGAATVFALPKLGTALPGLLPYGGAVRALELAVVGLLALAVLAQLLIGRPDPAYDRWTGARVVRA